MKVIVVRGGRDVEMVDKEKKGVGDFLFFFFFLKGILK